MADNGRSRQRATTVITKRGALFDASLLGAKRKDSLLVTHSTQSSPVVIRRSSLALDQFLGSPIDLKSRASVEKLRQYREKVGDECQKLQMWKSEWVATKSVETDTKSPNVDTPRRLGIPVDMTTRKSPLWEAAEKKLFPNSSFSQEDVLKGKELEVRKRLTRMNTFHIGGKDFDKEFLDLPRMTRSQSTLNVGEPSTSTSPQSSDCDAPVAGEIIIFGQLA